MLQRQPGSIAPFLSLRPPFVSSAQLGVSASNSSASTLDGTFKAFFKHLILLSTIGVSTHYAMFVTLWTCTGQTFFPMRRQSSNQSLERTADRRDNLLSMTSTLKSAAQRALVSRRPALSR